MPPTRRARNASTLADPGHIPPDLELDRIYVKDLRSLCSKLNLVQQTQLSPSTTGGRAALIKRITEARQNVANLPRTLPPNQDGGEHVESTAASSTIEQQFQQMQRQVQELLDREGNALHLVGIKCSSRHILAPVDSIFGGPTPSNFTPWS